MKTDKCVLLLTNNKSDADDILDLLKTLDIEVAVALDNETAVQAFEKHHPQLLLCARESVRDNEHLYLDLHRNCAQLYAIPHQTILLCKINEAKIAYELCRRGIFSDYVVDKPRHDVFRLRLSVEQMLANFELTQQQRQMGREFSSAGNKAKSLVNSVEKVRDKGQSIGKDSATKLQTLSDNVMQEMTNILSQLKPNDIVGLSKALNPEKLQNMITLAAQDVNNNIKSLNKALDAACGGHSTALDDLLASIKPVPATIVVIDDNKAFAKVIGDILSEEGYRVLLSNDARHGIGTVAQQDPDLILMDINMPGMDGLQATRTIKSNSRLKDIPIIILSGKGNRELVSQVKKTGANGFITKPTKAPVILDKVAKMLQKRGVV